LHAPAYCVFLMLPVTVVPLAVRGGIWYTHVGAQAHSSRAVRDVLNNTYHDRLIGTRESIAWPPLSPDLNPVEF
jgi:hypothetical protein